MTGWSREAIAQRAAQDIVEGSFVNLGIGLPEMVADFIPADREVVMHSENGILGMGPRPRAEDRDMELINAGKKPVTLLPGGSFFHHADSFAMIRGGHIDVCILGAFEVAVNGDIANWSAGAGGVPAVGGAMDLVAGAKQVRVISQHTTRQGAPKLIEELTLPATGRGVVDRVYTDLGVFAPDGECFAILELAPGVTQDLVRERTGAKVRA